MNQKHTLNQDKKPWATINVLLPVIFVSVLFIKKKRTQAIADARILYLIDTRAHKTTTHNI